MQVRKEGFYSQGMGDWSEAVFERLKVEGFVVWGSRFPACVEDADPFVSESANGGMVAFVAGTLAVVKGSGPGTVRD